MSQVIVGAGRGEGKIRRVFVGGGGEFIGLTDAPSSYSGAAGRFPRVNGAAEAIEFFDLFGAENTWSAHQALSADKQLRLRDGSMRVYSPDAQTMAVENVKTTSDVGSTILVRAKSGPHGFFGAAASATLESESESHVAAAAVRARSASDTVAVIVTADPLGGAGYQVEIDGGRLVLIAGTTALCSLRIPPGAGTSSPVDGDMHLDAASRALAIQTHGDGSAGLRGLIPKITFSAFSFASVTETTEEVPIVPTTDVIGAVDVPTNYFIPGKSIRVTASGTYSTDIASAPDITLRLYKGNDIMARTGAVPTAIASSYQWSLEVIVTCYVGPSSPEVMAFGWVRFASSTDGSTPPVVAPMNGGAFPDTPISILATGQTLSLTAQLSDDDAANTLNCYQLIVEELA